MHNVMHLFDSFTGEKWVNNNKKEDEKKNGSSFDEEKLREQNLHLCS